MNKFDEKYDIYLARYEDLDDIMNFIKDQWNPDHILAIDKEFFLYEHGIDGRISFLVARNKENQEIESILGYIPASRDKDHLDIWTGIWKTKAGAMAFLGMELMKRLRFMLGARTLAGVGDNPNTTVRLTKFFMKSFIEKMKQYYMLSDSVENSIAEIHHSVPKKVYIGQKTNVNLVKEFANLKKHYDFEKNMDVVPYKDAWYIEKRYFSHPINKYMVYELSQNNGVEALLVMREQKYRESKVLRIIDYIGNQELFAGLHSFFEKSLSYYEYIDFYTLGFEEKYIKNAGFVLRTEEDTNIIPNYFYPFEKCNIDIWVDSTNPDMIFMKGDGDQDRPNSRIQEE